MAAFVTRRALSRRRFLSGLGAALALPSLSAMVPALGVEPKPPLRALFIFAPNGKKMDEWSPKRGSFELPYLLEPLTPFKKELRVLSGLALKGAEALGDGPGDHARAAAAFLTGAHPKKTGGTDIRNDISIDQAIAASLKAPSRFGSLQLNAESGRASGVCDSGYACAYSNSISWRNAESPNPNESRPRAVFERLFGDPERALDAETTLRTQKIRRSVLDVVREDAKKLQSELGSSDRQVLEAYLESIRDIEKRLDASSADQKPAVTMPDALRKRGPPADYGEQLQLLYELIALAWQSDQTRIVTLMLGNAGSNRSYPMVGVKDGHHDMSHHGNDQGKLDKVRRINRWHIEQLAAFLGRLRATKDGGTNLLDASAIVYGSGISDGDRHSHHDLPILLAGGGSGRLPKAQHLEVAAHTPLTNLHLALLRAFGSEAASFSDSTGSLF